VALKHGDVEPGVVEKLGHRFVGEQRTKVGSIIGATPICGDGPGRKLHHVANAVPRRHLNQAQAIAMEVETGCLGIDRDAIAEVDVVREITLVELDGDAVDIHSAPLPPWRSYS
jgi:hypothetical protein